jgi:putative PIN family toxin of toxin-antitoxin system
VIVTFDSSILVRATKRSEGPARRLIDIIAAHPDHTIALSRFILGEVGKVLSYPRMQELFGLSGNEIVEHLNFLRAVCRIVEPRIGLPVVLRDPNDDAILYTALAAGADVLCVRDKHFFDSHVVTFCAREDIRVMNELELLAVLG